MYGASLCFLTSLSSTEDECHTLQILPTPVLFYPSQGYASMTKRLMAYAGGKVVLALEGGYNTRCVCLLVRKLAGVSLPLAALFTVPSF